MTKEQYKKMRISEIGDEYKKHSTSKRDCDMCILMECGECPSFKENTSAEMTLKMLLTCKYTTEQIVETLYKKFPDNDNKSRPQRTFYCFSGGKCRNIEEYREDGKLGLKWDRYKFFSELGKWQGNQEYVYAKQLTSEISSELKKRTFLNNNNIDNFLSKAESGNLKACSECPWSPKVIDNIGFGVSCIQHGFNWKEEGKILSMIVVQDPGDTTAQKGRLCIVHNAENPSDKSAQHNLELWKAAWGLFETSLLD